MARVDEHAGLLSPLQLEPCELVLQVARGLESIAAVKRERLQDRALERFGQLGCEITRPRNRAALDHLERFLPYKQRARADELEQHDAGGEQIGAPVDGLAGACSGDMYANLPLMTPCSSLTSRPRAMPKPAQLHLAVPDRHVLRRHVPVHDAERLRELVGLAVA